MLNNSLTMNNNNITSQNISADEARGRSIVVNNIDRILHGNPSVTENEITDPIDLTATTTYKGRDYKIGLEVKVFDKPCNYMAMVINGRRINPPIADSFMLKADKIQRMKAQRETDGLDYMLYVPILNDTIYVYDLDKVDWENINQADIYQKITQDNPNTKWYSTYTYFLPAADAYKTITIK